MEAVLEDTLGCAIDEEYELTLPIIDDASRASLFAGHGVSGCCQDAGGFPK